MRAELRCDALNLNLFLSHGRHADRAPASPRIRVIPACLLVLTEARRTQIRPRVTGPQVYYEEEDNQAAEDEFDTVAVYQPRTRALPSPRSKDALHGSKPPPVQTIRNYNKVNDDGSFTFGYEAADGSFKEETRGTDCVEEEELSGPANYPVVRPIPRPVSVRPTYQPTTTRAPTTIFQTEYQLDDDASQELTEDDLKPQLRPSAFRRPSTLVQVTPSTAIYESSPSSSPSLFRLASTPAQYQTTATPVLRSQPTVTSSVYQSLETTTRRPVTRHPSVRAQSVAITPRPHVAQVAAQYVSPSSTERPDSLLYAQTHPTISPLRTTTTANAPHLDFAAELERYVNTVGSHVSAAPVARPQTVQASPQPTSRVKLTGQTSVTAASAAAEPIYQSELVYDPATGQYNTQLYQTLPQTMTPWLMAFFCLATASCSNVTDQQTSETQHDQVAILKQIRKVNEDGSYTYGYEAGDGSFKVESRDVLGNIKGTFGFVDANGEIKRVSYSSSNGTGFKATTMSPLQEHVSVVQSMPRINRTLTTKRPTIVFATTTESSTRPSVVQSIPRTRKTTTSTTTTTTSTTTTEAPKTIFGHYLKGTAKNRPRLVINGQQRPIVIEEDIEDEDSQINRPSTDDKSGAYRKIIFAKRPIEHSLPPISEDFVEKEDEVKITTGNNLRRQLHDETTKSNSDDNDEHSDVYGGSLSTTRPLFTTSSPSRILQRVSTTPRTERPKFYVNRQENLGAGGRFDSPKYEDSQVYETQTKPPQEERTSTQQTLLHGSTTRVPAEIRDYVRQSTEPVFMRQQPEQYLRELPPRILVPSQPGNLEEEGGVYRAIPISRILLRPPSNHQPVYSSTTDANVHYLTETPVPDPEDEARIAINMNYMRSRPVRPLMYSDADQRARPILRPIPNAVVHPDDREYQATTPETVYPYRTGALPLPPEPPNPIAPPLSRRDFQMLLRRLLVSQYGVQALSYPKSFLEDALYDQQPYPSYPAGFQAPLPRPELAYDHKEYENDEILPAPIREALLLRMVNLAINTERSMTVPMTTTTPASRYRKAGPVRSVQIITDEEEEKEARKKM
ncbi:hypothetical protein ALC60_03131 [Trachymyrmex zeteki]|uniref:Cuticle protein 6 n=1 Tax=Mycetomoellerius zeteki TaxID=64791 RepID=A0A151XCL2_9HYME|nr:hypothetical protein ALC60_03131 [Trachymyrmex zeteki]